jgi:organic radical activating enzyme
MGRRYAVREVFASVQGEGAQAGTPAVFLRFAGCNLGYAVCPWCDTDWRDATLRGDADAVLAAVAAAAHRRWGALRPGLLLVVTGGEPTLQWDAALADAARGQGLRIAMETNGSRPVDHSLVDWLTVSPKTVNYVQREGDELKIVFTGADGPGIAPDVEAVRRLAAGTRFRHYFLQPLDVPGRGPNLEATLAALGELGPPWRLSVQLHKLLGLP